MVLRIDVELPAGFNEVVNDRAGPAGVRTAEPELDVWHDVPLLWPYQIEVRLPVVRSVAMCLFPATPDPAMDD